MIHVQHSKTGKGSVIFDDDTPLIVIRGNDWTFHLSSVTVYNPPKEVQKGMIRLAFETKLAKTRNTPFIKDGVEKLGIDHSFLYTFGVFKDDSINKAENDLGDM